MNFHLDFFEFKYPQKEIPSWSHKVERWYQLDAFAYGMIEAFHRNKHISFNEILLASPGASTETDYHYARSGTFSPQKFVHTLPNVRSSAALQYLEWEGPVFCLQKDPETLDMGLIELMASVKNGNKSLLISLFKLDLIYSSKENRKYGALILGADSKGEWQHIDEEVGAQLSDENRIEQLFTHKNKLSYSKGHFKSRQ